MEKDALTGLVSDALKDAGVEAPAGFAAKLAEAISDDAERMVLDRQYWEIDPQTMLDWHESEAETLEEYIAEEHCFDLMDHFHDNIRFSLGYGLEGMREPEFADARGMARERLSDITAKVCEELPMPELSIQGQPGFRCNIAIGTADDANEMFSSSDDICQAILDGDAPEPDSGSRALGWLMKSQGATLADVVSENGRFAKSLKSEIENCGGSFGAPTVLVTLDIDDVRTLKAGGSLLIPKEAPCGLVEFYSGGGGPLEIALDRDMVIDRSMIWELQFEGAKNSHYSVDSIHGLTGRAWDETVGHTDRTPIEPADFTDGDIEGFREAFAKAQKESQRTSERPW